MEWVVFSVSALAALAGAGGVVLSRKPVHAALSLVLTLFSVAVFFVLQGAHFLPRCRSSSTPGPSSSCSCS